MGNVISFDEGKRKRGNKSKSNKKKSKIVTEKTTAEYPAVLNSIKDGSNINVDYADMEPEQQLKYWKKIEKEEEERFRAQYSDVLEAVPADAGTRIQYFSATMLKLIPNIFHGSSWDTRFDAFMDFCQFYIIEFDPAYSDYIQKNKELEKPYLYKFKEMTAEKLEEELKDCFEKIIALYPEKTDADKTTMMYQAARLFELQELLSDLFYMEVMKD